MRKLISRGLLAATATCGLALTGPAWAGGAGMPWEGPLQQIVESVTGPVVQASDGPAATPGFIAGLLTQQVELNNERLEIGIVTHARYIRETIALLQNPLTPTTIAEGMTAVSGSRTASAEEAARD